MQLGKNECRLLLFLVKYSNSWHTIGQDSMPAARSLTNKGFIVMNEFKQATINTNRELIT